MICQRCLSGEAAYHVYTDEVDMKVCAICAEEARKLGISVELLANEETITRVHRHSSSRSCAGGEMISFCRTNLIIGKNPPQPED